MAGTARGILRLWAVRDWLGIARPQGSARHGCSRRAEFFFSHKSFRSLSKPTVILLEIARKAWKQDSLHFCNLFFWFWLQLEEIALLLGQLRVREIFMCADAQSSRLNLLLTGIQTVSGSREMTIGSCAELLFLLERQFSSFKCIARVQSIAS